MEPLSSLVTRRIAFHPDHSRAHRSTTPKSEANPALSRGRSNLQRPAGARPVTARNPGWGQRSTRNLASILKSWMEAGHHQTHPARQRALPQGDRTTARHMELGLNIGTHSVDSCSTQRQHQSMTMRQQLRRIAVYFLGVVDQYWALREPGQYGEQPPQCGLNCKGDACNRSEVR